MGWFLPDSPESIFSFMETYFTGKTPSQTLLSSLLVKTAFK
jgi:hypothetical protein